MEQLESDVKRIVDPSYALELNRLSTDELRGRKEEAEAVETMVSYARRVVQGRLDTFELERAASGPGGQNADALTRLTSALGRNTVSQGSGYGRFVDANLDDTQIELAEKTINGLVEAERAKSPQADETERLLQSYRAVEATISAWRKELFAVIDSIRAELIKRYKGDSAMIDQLLNKVMHRED